MSPIDMIDWHKLAKQASFKERVRDAFTVSGVFYERSKATKPQVKFDTMKAFAGMGAAVEVLMKAAPNAFTHATVSGKEQQGKLRRRKAA
ncbi:hypothetical protein PSK34_01135 [Escherichia coli]|nr:hypothetical protein [Escherichia coli]